MAKMRYVILQQGEALTIVEMPTTHAYQLSALNLRLNKEIDKLTAQSIPTLPIVIAECDNIDLHTTIFSIKNGLHYINELEQQFSSINEQHYPLISLLTEIRALQAQLEQWYEDDEDGLIL